MGSASFATAEAWREISRESDRAARAEVMKSSSELEELNELERKTQEFRQRAEAKNAELNRLCRNTAIPDRIHAAQSELNSINNGLADLDSSKLREGFKHHFRIVLDGGITDPFAQAQLAAVIVTADLRREVLNERASELEGDESEEARVLS